MRFGLLMWMAFLLALLPAAPAPVIAQTGAPGPAPVAVLDTTGFWRMHNTLSAPVLLSDGQSKPFPFYSGKQTYQVNEIMMWAAMIGGPTAPPEAHWTRTDFDDSAWVRATALRACRTPYLERFIHSEIYKTRPEVQSVVHSHSPSVIPFGVVARRLQPIYHMSSFLGAGVPVFEIRDTGGPATDMLIRNPALGAALARSLGGCTVALLRGHGNVVVGGSIRETVFRAVYTEVNAKLATEALRLGDGEVSFLNEGEAAASTATNQAQIGRAWDLWKAKVLDPGG